MNLLKNAHALLIGISYEDGLDTTGDARDVAKVLIDPLLCGYPEKNVTLLTNEQADRKGILGALDELIRRTDAHSSIFLYYSGHGDIIEDTFHFVPHGIVEGMELEEYTEAWVTAGEIKDKINQLASKRLIFFMDCCHATGMALGGFTLNKKDTSPADNKVNNSNFTKLEGLAQKVDNERGISILASCKEDQKSYQLEDDKNSLFTKHLLMALKGEHQTEFNDPYVRILEVASYLLRIIPPTIEKIGKACDPPLDIKQEPYINLEMYDNFILSYVPKKIREKHHIEAVSPTKAKSPKPTENQTTVFRETPNANNLILFINGFTGEGSDSFGKLPELLMQSDALKGWDMKPFGYSKFIQPEFGKHVWGGIKDIDRICDYLCTSIKYKFEKYGRVALVCHGLGGLVAQRALLNFPQEYKEKVSHLILMGCPSNGIPPETLKNSGFDDLHEIGQESNFITRLRKDWIQHFGMETSFTLKVIAATDDEYVPMDSCFTPFAKEACIPIEGNHFSMVKPRDVSNAAYTLVLDSLTHSELFHEYGNKEEINLALGKFSTVAKTLGPIQNELDLKGLKQLIFALEGLDRREEALAILEQHELAQNNTDLMGIIGGRYKRNYLKVPTKADGEAALVYYGLAFEMATAKKDKEQIYYLAINLAFLNLVFLEDKAGMASYANIAKEAAESTPDGIWKFATLGEAHMYLGHEKEAMGYYEKAAELAGVREKISMHLNASTGYAHLMNSSKQNATFQLFLREQFLS
jgi:pimeloyl-ACP methyl ester carboxylesterase